MEDPSRTARFATNILINNLPKDFYKTFLQKINSITLVDVKNVSDKYFNETNSRIVIVGNGSKILPKLMRLGYPIKKYDRYADPIIEKPADKNVGQTAKTNNNISVYEIVEGYLKAIGGKEEIAKINSISSVISFDMMGRTFEGINKKMSPNKELTEIKMGKTTVMKSVFDGGKGFQEQMGQKKEMTEQEIKAGQDEKGVIPQLYYVSNAEYKTEYLGIGKINDEETYRMKVLMPSGKLSVQEYSIKTGLLLKEENTTTREGKEVIELAEYKDYKKVGNILLPYEIVRTTEGQEITFKYSSIKLNEDVTDADFK